MCLERQKQGGRNEVTWVWKGLIMCKLSVRLGFSSGPLGSGERAPSHSGARRTLQSRQLTIPASFALKPTPVL